MDIEHHKCLGGSICEGFRVVTEFCVLMVYKRLNVEQSIYILVGF